jgi:hypothetical protein
MGYPFFNGWIMGGSMQNSERPVENFNLTVFSMASGPGDREAIENTVKLKFFLNKNNTSFPIIFLQS